MKAKLKTPIEIKGKMLNVNSLNRNHRVYSKTLIQRIVSDNSLINLPIFLDAEEGDGLNTKTIGYVSGLTLKKDTLSYECLVESKYITEPKNKYTLVPVGTGVIVNRIILDYNFYGFIICLKKESAYFTSKGSLISNPISEEVIKNITKVFNDTEDKIIIS